MKALETIAQPVAHLRGPVRLAKLVIAGWEVATYNECQTMWVDRVRRLAVMEGIELHDGQRWHHISMSHADRLPTWAEMSEAKQTFIGVDVEAYLIHPPAERYVNLYDRVLHWYASLDRPSGVLPDFRAESRSPTGARVVGI